MICCLGRVVRQRSALCTTSPRARDEVDALALTDEHAEIGDRVAVDEQQVGRRAGRDDAELAGLAEQLGVDERR